jgi:hypothetical protein
MVKLAGIAGVIAAAIALSIGALGIASAQDGTSTPSTSTTQTTGGSMTPAVSGTATPDDADDPLDTEDDGTDAESSGGVGGATTAPAAGTGSIRGGDNIATGLFFIALSVMSAGAAAVLLGMNRRTA